MCGLLIVTYFNYWGVALPARRVGFVWLYEAEEFARYTCVELLLGSSLFALGASFGVVRGGGWWMTNRYQWFVRTTTCDGKNTDASLLPSRAGADGDFVVCVADVP